ncbi:MAG TPA: formyltetrahydrofolate deformylase [Candidatus Dormibacteraeota bacterium]|jgi:formyltetrahydrofolate deformylase|nr:formyltetrahydrofolate deformylase [Candidatus Dormibacteraeota bacterium]
MSSATEGPTAILLIRCPDQHGLVARTAQFVAERNGNVVHADHHIDRATGLFLMRMEWELAGFDVERDGIAAAFAPLAERIGATWRLHFSDVVRRVAIWVTKQDHCLGDLILRRRAGELRCEIPVVMSNHDTLRDLCDRFDIEFQHVPVERDDRGGAPVHETRQLALLREHSVDLVVLAKYMQVLSPAFLRAFPDVINIHHSFLPAFAGAGPYLQAHQRGVKIIGATAHYVTDDLDAGPIIEQDTVRISHRDSVDDLIRKGKDLERVVLARAVRAHLEDRVLVHGNRTSVFD